MVAGAPADITARDLFRGRQRRRQSHQIRERIEKEGGRRRLTRALQRPSGQGIPLLLMSTEVPLLLRDVPLSTFVSVGSEQRKSLIPAFRRVLPCVVL